MKEDNNKYADVKVRRPSGNGCPSWLAALLVEKWADKAFPVPPNMKSEICGKCNIVTQHTVQSYCTSIIHKCNNCGKLNFEN